MSCLPPERVSLPNHFPSPSLPILSPTFFPPLPPCLSNTSTARSSLQESDEDHKTRRTTTHSVRSTKAERRTGNKCKGGAAISTKRWILQTFRTVSKSHTTATRPGTFHPMKDFSPERSLRISAFGLHQVISRPSSVPRETGAILQKVRLLHLLQPVDIKHMC